MVGEATGSANPPHYFFRAGRQRVGPLRRERRNWGGQPEHTRGFFNIGASPTSFDPGNGGTDPYGNPLSAARMFLAEQLGEITVDPSGITDPCNTATLIEPGGTPRYPGCDANLADATDKVDPAFDWSKEREQVMGSFKTPIIRNVDRFVTPLQLTETEIDDLTAFMLSMTDRRVQCDQVPFDHPSLKIFVDHRSTDKNRDGKADDVEFELPEIGAGGYDPSSGFCVPNAGDLFAPGMQARSGGERRPLAE